MYIDFETKFAYTSRKEAEFDKAFTRHLKKHPEDESRRAEFETIFNEGWKRRSQE